MKKIVKQAKSESVKQKMDIDMTLLSESVKEVALLKYDQFKEYLTIY